MKWGNLKWRRKNKNVRPVPVLSWMSFRVDETQVNVLFDRYGVTEISSMVMKGRRTVKIEGNNVDSWEFYIDEGMPWVRQQPLGLEIVGMVVTLGELKEAIPRVTDQEVET